MLLGKPTEYIQLTMEMEQILFLIFQSKACVIDMHIPKFIRIIV